MNAPHPWLQWAVALALSVGGTLATNAFKAGESSSDLRHAISRVDQHEDRLQALEIYRGDLREALAEIKADLTHQRKALDEVHALLRGGMSRR